MPLSRRTFLAGAGAAAGLAATTATAAAATAATAVAAPRRVPVVREDHGVVVVGTGFGGGVTALRFAQAGIPVTLLERGIRWPTGPNADTFPHPTTGGLDRRLMWMNSALNALSGPASSLGLLLGRTAEAARLPIVGSLPAVPYTGVLEVVPGNGMDIYCGAGVGGGSLLYQGMTLQPTAEVFDANFPAQLDYARMAREHYPRVARMLKLETAPDDLVASPTYAPARAFARRVRAAGMNLEKIPMPIDWTFAQRELRGEMRPSYTNGDCALGVNNGGKHSVDVTYVAAAEATGRVTVATLHQVTDVGRLPDGRWQVSVDRIATDGTVQEKKLLTCRALVMAAGTANTVKLLMRAQHRGTIPDLPDGLGSGWGSNGDQIVGWTSLTDGFGAPQGGPVVYGSKDWADPASANTIIQASIPPLPDLATTITVGYGVSAGRGRFTWDPARDEAVLQWSRSADAPIRRTILDRMRTIVGPAAVLLNTTDLSTNTWHPVGGASMGSVCDLDGRVLGQRGLYVLDGALMPGNSAACNPSMTIAAIVERATDGILARDRQLLAA